ncbi:hypothetical protein [Actinomadura chokoriensis]|uniref:hypothetical protein n=1 Tax=Actinomadura chokoriensis TaxID=454156 RepID=UPI0031F958A4
MGVERNGNGTDGPENVDKSPAQDRAWRSPPDRPGSPGQPSRLEGRAAAAGRELPAEQSDERDDEQPPAAAEKPQAEAEKESSDDDRLREDRPPGASPVEDAGQKADKDPGESEDARPATADRPGAERDEQAAEQDDDDEPGDARATDAQPEPEGEPEKPSGSDVWEKFANESATYTLDGREFGYRTWGEEFEARRASREAMGKRAEARQAEVQDEPVDRDETTSAKEKAPADAGADEPGNETAGSDETGAAEADAEAAAEMAAQDDAWREHADSMRSKWADLEAEQTPDEPPEESDEGEDPQGEGTSEDADLPGDEPGSWRGDGDQYLNYEENYSVDRSFSRLRDREIDVTDDLKTQEAEMVDVKLVGLEYRLKGEDRFKEKVAEKLAAEFRKSPTEAADSISDGLRYTYQVPVDKYAQGYRQIADGLRDKGNEMVFCRNSWDAPEYKGVNTRWRTPDGQLFEVQFHTPESFEAKQLTHKAYERQRNPLTSGQERVKLKAFQREVSAGIPVPAAVGDISDYRKEGY